jgi:arylsulfatase A-like enzyme
VARWPGRIEAGSTSDDLIVLNDIFATTAALLGIDPGLDSGGDSFPIRPLLGKEAPLSATRKAAVFQSALGLFAVREGPWKLIRGHGGGALYDREARAAPGGPPGQLYQLDRDPGETTNVWKDHPETVSRLSVLLDRVLSASERSVYELKIEN